MGVPESMTRSRIAGHIQCNKRGTSEHWEHKGKPNTGRAKDSKHIWFEEILNSYTIVKLLSVKHKEKILKQATQIDQIAYKRTQISITADLSEETF